MDYKYIEQLLDRYWECHTSEEEEQILRSFFAQKDVPAHLAQYASLFTFMKEAQEERVSDDFDDRFADILAEESLRHDVVRTQARTIPFRQRIAPFLQAAAAVAVLLTIGGAAERAIGGSQQEEGTAAPVVANTYIRSDRVAEVVTPVDSKNEATAIVQPDSMTRTQMGVDAQVKEN
jgi:hypothetical protein